MNIHTADIAHLPLVAALVSPSGKILASTPEWKGEADEAISYPIRDMRLIVNPMDPSAADPSAKVAMDTMITQLEDTANQSDPATKSRLRMLAVSLRAVMGRDCTTNGVITDLVNAVNAGIDARLGARPQIKLLCPPTERCQAPEALALLLIQMVVNAHVHAKIAVPDITVTIHNPRRFGVTWPGRPPLRPVKTSRLDDPEQGWGLAFAQTIADTLGGRVYPPRADGPDRVRTACEIDVNRVVIPLALVGPTQTILQASPTWIEETNWKVGDAVTGKIWSPLINAAKSRPERVIFQDGRSARFHEDASRLWLGIPPVDLPDRIDAALHGIDHEARLWEEIDSRSAYRIRALSKIVRWLRTGEPPSNNRAYWVSHWGSAITALTGEDLRAPGVTDVTLIDAIVCAYLFSVYGRSLSSRGGTLFMHAKGEAMDDQIWIALSKNQRSMALSSPTEDWSEPPSEPEEPQPTDTSAKTPTFGLPLA